jgi:hypothetical protein
VGPGAGDGERHPATRAGIGCSAGRPREARVFKLIGKLIRMAIILSVIATIFNKVVKPRMNPGEEESA